MSQYKFSILKDSIACEAGDKTCDPQGGTCFAVLMFYKSTHMIKLSNFVGVKMVIQDPHVLSKMQYLKLIYCLVCDFII